MAALSALRSNPALRDIAAKLKTRGKPSKVILTAKMAERDVRSIAYHTKVARLPSYKDLAGFDFASSDINEATVRQLHRGAFIENAEHVVLIGGPGTGKSQVRWAVTSIASDEIPETTCIT